MTTTIEIKTADQLVGKNCLEIDTAWYVIIPDGQEVVTCINVDGFFESSEHTVLAYKTDGTAFEIYTDTVVLMVSGDFRLLPVSSMLVLGSDPFAKLPRIDLRDHSKMRSDATGDNEGN